MRFLFIFIFINSLSANVVAQENKPQKTKFEKAQSSAKTVRNKTQENDPPSVVVLKNDTVPNNMASKPGLLSGKFWQNKPRTAALMSAVVPGAGQVYNKKWWKVPIVYGLLGSMTYLYIDNITEYEKYRAEFIYLDNNPSQPSAFPGLTQSSVQIYRDQYLSNAELAGFGLILSYLVNVGDAYVDRHLMEFDVSDDLSMRVQPSKQGVGVGVVLTFK